MIYGSIRFWVKGKEKYLGYRGYDLAIGVLWSSSSLFVSCLWDTGDHGFRVQEIKFRAHR